MVTRYLSTLGVLLCAVWSFEQEECQPLKWGEIQVAALEMTVYERDGRISITMVLRIQEIALCRMNTKHSARYLMC